MRFTILFIFCYVLLGLVIDVSIWFLTPVRKTRFLKISYTVFSILCMALLIVALALPWRNVNSSLVPKMWLLYTWLSIYVVKLCVLIFAIVGFLPCVWRGKRINLGVYIGLPVGLILFAIMWWGATGGRRAIDVINVDIVSPRLPEAFCGFKIVQISDLHLGTWGEDTSFVSELVDSVNACNADLIVFTGDIVNRDAKEMRPFLTVLKRLHAPYGVWSIMGNHDYGEYGDWDTPRQAKENESCLRSMQREMGWSMLANEHIILYKDNDSIALIGVENWGEPPFSSYGDFNKALMTSKGGNSILQPYGKEYKILLTHNPEHWRRIVRNQSNTDLTLSGHTHAMQMEVKLGRQRWSPASFRYETWGGLYVDDSTESIPAPLLYVNIGAGEVGLPFRIGATPEITLFTFNNKGICTQAIPAL